MNNLKQYKISDRAKEEIKRALTKIEADHAQEAMEAIPWIENYLTAMEREFTPEQLKKINDYCKQNFVNKISPYNIYKLCKPSMHASFISDLKKPRTSYGITESTNRGLQSETAILELIGGKQGIWKDWLGFYPQCQLDQLMHNCVRVDVGDTWHEFLTKYPDIFDCHVDLLARPPKGLPILLEFKSTSTDLPEHVTQFPDQYYCQVQTYLALSQLPKAYVLYTACYDTENDEGVIDLAEEFRCFTVKYDKTKDNQIKTALLVFLQGILTEIESPEQITELGRKGDEILMLQYEVDALNVLVEALHKKHIAPILEKQQGIKAEIIARNDELKNYPSAVLVKAQGIASRFDYKPGGKSLKLVNEKAIIEKYKDDESVKFITMPKPLPAKVNRSKLKSSPLLGEVIANHFAEWEIGADSVAVVARDKGVKEKGV